MSKRSKRRKTVELRERNKTKQVVEISEVSNDDVKVRPVLTGMLVASILVVVAISIIDGNNVYKEYCNQHDGVPQIMACVDALSEGVLPWTRITAYAAYDQYADGGPGVIDKVEDMVEEKMPELETNPSGTSVTETKKADGAKQAIIGAGSAAGAEVKCETETKATVPAGAGGGKAKTYTRVDMSYFDDAAFVGDSFTQGMMLYGEVPGADCLCYQSKTTKNIMDSEIHLKNGNTSTVRNELSKKQYGKVYIMLGINELSKDAGKFAERYQKVIDEIRALQPNAIIYVQSIFHTTPSKSASSNFKNDIIDMNNQALKGLADNKTVFYVDVNPPFDDGTGALKADYSGDGVHLKASRYKDWRDYLLNFGIAK